MPSKEMHTKPIRTRTRITVNELESATDSVLPAIYYINKLTSVFPARGSCTPELEKAADYIHFILQEAGVKNIKKEKFPGKTSTYRPYLLIFFAALLGSIPVIITPTPGMLILGCILIDLALAAFLAETSFTSNWTHWLLPKSSGCNIFGRIPAAEETKHTVLIAAHLDAHRTPVFFSSSFWHKLFQTIMSSAVASLVIGFILFALALAFNWSWIRWVAVILAVVYFFVAILCWHADQTPYSPSANDNGSGVAVTLRLAQKLAKEPLKHTETWVLFNDCEETGAVGMMHFLSNHKKDTGEKCLIFCPDMVGESKLQYIVRDGLVLQYKSQPEIISIAEKAAQSVEGYMVAPATGIAYTDATAATKMGYTAISLVSVPGNGEFSHWHQVSDLPEFVQSKTLEHTEDYLLKILEIIDTSDNTKQETALAISDTE